MTCEIHHGIIEHESDLNPEIISNQSKDRSSLLEMIPDGFEIVYGDGDSVIIRKKS